MRINREELLKQLESVLPGLSTREIIEQSSCFVFEDDTVMTYNDEVACTIDSCLPIQGAVQALPFVSILRKLKEETLEIRVQKEELLIKGKRKRIGIRMEADILLPIEAVEMPKTWKDLPDDFADAVAVVQLCAGKDMTKFALTCVHLHHKWIQACDGFSAARYRLKLDIDRPTLIRKESLKNVLSLDMTEFGEAENWIHFRNSSGLVLSIRRWEESFPKISKLLRVEGIETSFPKGLIEAAEKASVFSIDNAEDNEVIISLQPNRLQITGVGATGYYKEIKKIRYKGQSLSFKIAPDLLIDLVRRHSSYEISTDKLKVTTGKYTYVTVLG